MKNKFSLYIFAASLFIVGTACGVRLFVWGLDEIEMMSTSSSIVLCFSASLAFFALGCFGFMLFTFGRGAYLRIENGRVKAQYGMNRTLDISLESVEDVAVMGSTMHIFTAKTVHSVSAPAEKADVLMLIGTAKKPWEINEGAERKNYEKAKRAHIVAMTAVCILLASLVLNVVLCSQLTGGKAPAELTPAEDGLWLAFYFAALLAIVASFFAADRAGKLTLERERRMRRIGSYIGYMRRYDGLDEASAQRVVLFDSYRIRAHVKYIYGSFVFDMELIDPVSGEWVLAESEVYDTREEAFDAVELKLGDVPLNEDKLFD